MIKNLNIHAEKLIALYGFYRSAMSAAARHPRGSYERRCLVLGAWRARQRFNALREQGRRILPSWIPGVEVHRMPCQVSNAVICTVDNKTAIWDPIRFTWKPCAITAGDIRRDTKNLFERIV